MTTACPPSDHLARLLDDSLPPADEADLARHLEDCPSCVQALERLTTPAGTSLSATVSLRAERAALPRSELSRLRDLLPLTVSQPCEPVAPNPDLPQIPGYEVEREIGRGGMGVVYLARHTELNRPVALKMILAGRHATPDQVIRFLAEAQTCAGLRHENIVPVYEVGRHDGLPFYAMEYVPGGTLAEHARRTPFTPRAAAAVVEQLARAMHAAHARGVVHRDLKPVNVLLRDRENAAPVPLVTDFGLAKHFEGGAGLTQTGAFLGTPDYMAPEQLDPAAAVGPAADVHALGAVLYFLLAGRPPFAVATQLDTLDRVRRAEPVSPSTYARGVPRDLGVVCVRCLQKDPTRRYATAEALADDLRRFLAGEPIAARPVTEMERVWKWAARNPAVAGLAATLAGVVLVALVLVSWQWYAAEEARGREAERANAEAGAKRAEAKARREAQVITAGYALDQGIAECRAGDVRAGLLQMVRALELLPPGEPDMEFAVRANIGAWRERRCPDAIGPHHGTAVVSVAFSPDGAGVLTGNWGNYNGDPGPAKIQLWNAARFGGEPRWTADHPAEPTRNRFKAVWSVAFSPDGGRIAVGGFDGTARVLDAATGRDRFPPLPHPGWVYAVAFSPDGNTLAVGGAVNDPAQLPTGAGELRLWNAHTGAALGPAVPLPVRVQALGWHPDGRTLAVGGTDPGKVGSGAGGAAFLFDVEKRAAVPPALPHGDTVAAVGFHPNGKTLATGCRDGLVRFWSVPDGKLLPRLLRHADPLTGLTFSASGDVLATSAGHHEPGARAGTGTVRVWDTETGTLLVAPHFDPAPGQSQKMHAVAFGAGDRKLAAVSEHGKAHLWELPPPNRPRLDLTFDAWADLFPSPGGRTLALVLMPPLQRGFAQEPCTVALLDPADGTVRARLPHPSVVRVAFTHDGRRVFTFTQPDAREPRVVMWDAATGRALPLPGGFGPALADLHVPPDGSPITTVAGDGTVRQWDATTLAPVGRSAALAAGERVLGFADAGVWAVVTGPGGTRLLALPDGREVAELATSPSATPGDGRPVSLAAFTADGAVAVTTMLGAPVPVQRWAVKGGAELLPAPLAGCVVSVRHPDGDRFLLTHVPGATSRLWNAATNELSPAVIPVSGKVAFHPGGQLLAATQSGTASACQLWGLAGKPIGPAFPHALLSGVEFLPNGRELVTSSTGKTVKVWLLPTPAAGTSDELRAAL